MVQFLAKSRSHTEDQMSQSIEHIYKKKTEARVPISWYGKNGMTE